MAKMSSKQEEEEELFSFDLIDENEHIISSQSVNKPERHFRKKNKKEKSLKQRQERHAKYLPTKNFFLGKHKWLGGAVDAESGIIYGVPSDAIEIICIHPPVDHQSETNITTIKLPVQYREGSFKWLRGIIVNGFLYGIPAWNTSGVLKVRLDKDGIGNDEDYYTKRKKDPRVKILPLDSSLLLNSVGRINRKDQTKSVRRDLWMWHGAGLSKKPTEKSPMGAIFCIPSNAERVLKVDIATDEVRAIGPSFKEGQNKWYGGIVGKDGAIYGIPYTATGVLRINPETEEVEVLGNFPLGGWKWHGGLMAPSNGVIYAFPAHSNKVLCIDTNPSSLSDNLWRVSTIPIEKHKDDNDSDDLRYKWLGGSHGADGCVYGMPSDATSVLRIDPKNSKAITFGKVPIQQNKWQGGVLCPSDKCVYAVPADSDVVLKIDTNPETPPAIEYIPLPLDDENSIGVSKETEDKWQGGFLARDGSIYGICENSCRVMKLVPGDSAKVEFL